MKFVIRCEAVRVGIAGLALTGALSLACGGGNSSLTSASSEPEETTTAEEPTETPEVVASNTPAKDETDYKAACVAVFQKQLTCAPDFSAGLVRLRVEKDMPAGFAKRAKQEGLDVLNAETEKELRADATAENIERKCSEVADNTPQEKLEEVFKGTHYCVVMESCFEFTGCIIPILEKTM